MSPLRLPARRIQYTPSLRCFPPALSKISLQEDPGFSSVPYLWVSSNWRAFHLPFKQTYSSPLRYFNAPSWALLPQAHDPSPSLKMVGMTSLQLRVSGTHNWPLTMAANKTTRHGVSKTIFMFMWLCIDVLYFQCPETFRCAAAFLAGKATRVHCSDFFVRRLSKGGYSSRKTTKGEKERAWQRGCYFMALFLPAG